MIYFITFLCLITIDQLSKLYIVNNFQLLHSYTIINDIFYITYIKNAGAAFGILQNYQLFFIIITSIIMIIVFIYFIITPKDNRFLRFALILILAGGVGNLIDRIRFGYVIDFLNIDIWPIFNFADSLIVIGSVLLGYYIMFKYK